MQLALAGPSQRGYVDGRELFRELTRAHHRSDRGLFGRRHQFVLTDAVTRSIGEREFERMRVEQGYHPVLLADDGDTYWWYSNRYYRGDPGMTADVAVRPV